MDMQKDVLLYQEWDNYWKKDIKEPMTVLGRIMSKYRMDKTLEILKDLNVRTAIELGCGFGRTLQILDTSGLDYIGIDVSQHAIDVCQKKGFNAKIGKLEEQDGTYDLVSSEGMLEHFLNFEYYAKHFMRLSNKYVLLIQPNHQSFAGRTLYYLALLLRSHINIFEYNYRVEDYIYIFENNGFSVIENIPLFYNTSRLLLFRKNISN
ncbi:MAG: class I SAM-dependent methyltransferase [archaeon]|nr:class I SAM-dependent methyltransferase [archaeon]